MAQGWHRANSQKKDGCYYLTMLGTAFWIGYKVAPNNLTGQERHGSGHLTSTRFLGKNHGAVGGGLLRPRGTFLPPPNQAHTPEGDQLLWTVPEG